MRAYQAASVDQLAAHSAPYADSATAAPPPEPDGDAAFSANLLVLQAMYSDGAAGDQRPLAAAEDEEAAILKESHVMALGNAARVQMDVSAEVPPSAATPPTTPTARPSSAQAAAARASVPRLAIDPSKNAAIQQTAMAEAGQEEAALLALQAHEAVVGALLPGEADWLAARSAKAAAAMQEAEAEQAAELAAKPALSRLGLGVATKLKMFSGRQKKAAEEAMTNTALVALAGRYEFEAEQRQVLAEEPELLPGEDRWLQERGEAKRAAAGAELRARATEEVRLVLVLVLVVVLMLLVVVVVLLVLTPCSQVVALLHELADSVVTDKLEKAVMMGALLAEVRMMLLLLLLLLTLQFLLLLLVLTPLLLSLQLAGGVVDAAYLAAARLQAAAAAAMVEAGAALFEAGRWEEALDEFTAAVTTVARDELLELAEQLPQPLVEWHTWRGQCFSMMGDAEHACK